jgi:NADH-quinone oxidoreductase subunit C
MAAKTELLSQDLQRVLGDAIQRLDLAFGEVTVVIKAEDFMRVATTLRDHPELRFEQLTSVCGVDYKDYGNGLYEGPRFAAVYQLLSVSKNRRLRVRVFCPSDDFPLVPSVVDIWPSANWYEREAFDLFGIVFEGHPDLRRILTDYGFIGHPFRKDFPISGYVEMRYDPDRQRVVYQPVTIEPREITPRVVREEHFGDVE